MRDGRIAVVGSINLDTVVRVSHLPRAGETLLGSEHFTAPGGKGANQAVAAARLDRATSFVGLVGDDAAGAVLRTALEGDGVHTGHLGTARGVASGSAFITIDAEGENTIVVNPGANAMVSPAIVTAAAAEIADAAAVLLQLEVPAAAVARAAELATGTVILNPAPAADLEAGLLERVDVLVPNETELARLAGRHPLTTPEEAAEAAAHIIGPGAAVVTLGEAGAVVIEGGHATLVPAPRVEVVDVTAAGDAFCAALADAIVGGAGLVGAASWAVQAAAIAVTRPGAQPSLPTRSEVEAVA